MHSDDESSDLHRALTEGEARQLWRDVRGLTSVVGELKNSIIRMEGQLTSAAKSADANMHLATEMAVLKSEVDLLKKIVYGLIGTILLGVLASGGGALMWAIGHMSTAAKAIQ
jgi:hypothetical protein